MPISTIVFTIFAQNLYNYYSMKKQLLTGLFTVFALAASAQSNEWRNLQVNAVNRAPMHTNYFAYENADAAKKD